MRPTHLATVLAGIALVAACTEAEPDEAAVDEPDAVEEELPDDLEGLLDAEPEDVEVDDDGNFRGQGVVVPVPDGWQVDPAALDAGLVTATPDMQGLPGLAAAAGIGDNPFLGFQGMDFEAALDAVRQLDPQADPTVDESVDIAGAERARLLVFEGLESPVAEGQEPLPDTDQMVVLAEDAAQGLAIFNYSAETGAYDDGIEQLLLAEAGFDADSEPTLPEMPELPDQDELGDLEDELEQ